MLTSKEAFMFVSTIMWARHHDFSKLKSNGYTYHQVLNPVSFNHGVHDTFVMNYTLNNSLPSIVKFANVLLFYLCFVFGKLELISILLQWHYSYILPLLFTCLSRRERGRIPGRDARNWSNTKTTHYYFQYVGPIKDCLKILANSVSLLSLRIHSLFCKSLYSFPW